MERMRKRRGMVRAGMGCGEVERDEASASPKVRPPVVVGRFMTLHLIRWNGSTSSVSIERTSGIRPESSILIGGGSRPEGSEIAKAKFNPARRKADASAAGALCDFRLPGALRPRPGGEGAAEAPFPSFGASAPA